MRCSGAPRAPAACLALLAAFVHVALAFPRTNISCECGVVTDDVADRIVGGSIAAPHLYPWMVAILNGGKMHCGGSLINDRYVLTAGHCFNWARKEDLTVVLGLHDRVAMNDGSERVLSVDQMIVHEAFGSDYLHDTEDIALIRLKAPVPFNAYIAPVCLAEPSGWGQDAYADRIAYVTGWGRTAQGGTPSRFLRKANVKILSMAHCRNTTIGEHILDSMLCAYEYETDACQGDSGGPLVYEPRAGKVEQIGVVSWGIGCARPGMPGVYTTVAYYRDWILAHTADAVYCANRFG
uniref:Serine protease like protein n=1 Tax=Meloimorpha japonica TaxID=1109092 RepID=G5EMR5_9ORTH|nr:serine protease like protein [Meloimorpha japonica]